MEIKDFFLNYNVAPEYEVLETELQSAKGLTEDALKKSNLLLTELKSDMSPRSNIDWLTDATEKFCQEKAIYNAMVDSMEILEGKNQKSSKGAIPQLLSEALAVTFDPNIGHDYFEDVSKQYDFYHKIENKLPFDLALFNEITNGGIPEKTLTVALAGIHVGKTMMMCHCAAAALFQGYDVLYITLEMSEEQIIKRIDANLMDIAISKLDTLSREEYIRLSGMLKSKTQGRLIVKEYPTGAASTLHFQSLLDDLRLKRNFRPAIIFIDYINLCASARLRPGSTNSYGYVKAISEELRGLAITNITRVFTATQLTRDGFKSSDPDLTNTAESFGLPATADFMFAMMINDELEKLQQLMVIQLKNRFGDMNHMRRFVIGVNKSMMKFYDVAKKESENLIDPQTGTKTKMFFDDKFKKDDNKAKSFEDIKW